MTGGFKRYSSYAVVMGMYLVGLLAFGAARSAVPVHAEAPVRINELAWAGSSISASDEWLELYNPGDSAVDISGWQITKGTPTEELMVTLPVAATIQPGGYYIISNFPAAQSVLANEPELVEPAITLSNTALLVRLYSGDWHSATNLVDTAGEGGVPPAGNNSLKLSMERDSKGWHDAQDALNLDPGVVDQATPGAANSELIVPPALTSITPASGVAGSELTIESIVGDNFVAPVGVQLVQGAKIVAGQEIHVASESLIDGGFFSIPEDGLGSWDLVVTVASGLTATLPQAVSIGAPPPEQDLSMDIRINEVYPRPTTTADDEFIELANTGVKTVNLSGWSIDDVADGGSSPYQLSGSIQPGSFVTLSKTTSKITLNDSGDSVRLIQPSGLVLDSTTYQAAPAGEAWARGQTEWQWTQTPTPNGNNVIFHSDDTEQGPTDDPGDEPDDPKPSYKKNSVEIDEVLPRPIEDADEFIELHNTTSKTIDLSEWKLGDKTSRRYALKNLRISAGGRVVIYGEVSNIALNDSNGERVALYAPDGKEISSLEYPDRAPEMAAFIRTQTGGTWVTTATPGENNPTDFVEIEAEVGGWVAADTVGSLPVTGNPAMSWLLTVWTLISIMIWQIRHDQRF